MGLWIFIASLLFDLVVGALVGAMTWFFCHRRLSSGGAGAVIAGGCALLIAAAWSASAFLNGTLLLQLICGFLIGPFSLACFSGAISSLPVAALLQVLLMGGVGWLVWRGLVMLEHQEADR